jgi:hypothetical protein
MMQSTSAPPAFGEKREVESHREMVRNRRSFGSVAGVRLTASRLLAADSGLTSIPGPHGIRCLPSTH